MTQNVEHIKIAKSVFDYNRIYFNDKLNIFISKNLQSVDKRIWDIFYEDKKTIINIISNMYKNLFVTRLVKKYCDKILPDTGLILESGCGTGLASSKIPKKERIFISLDISLFPLIHHKNSNTDIKLQADISDIPILDNTIDAIFNLGVHEHFTWDKNVKILAEFKRILKDDGIILLFWPWKYCWVELISKLKPLFPKSPMMYGSFDSMRLFNEVGLEKINEELSPIDGFIHKIILLRKI